uniref:Uncharacterized protein n=1 Tax=Zooxanthella nutricula TaxID=1333877 RepID=A0A6U6H108_9DINO|mmetsp:Transcript_11531/g.34239  ORF Transcript_11531/g.34239 Transcript_11531/m.34239 type:complete len:132 (+) Transcript_11531:66-461(+)|eukprot:CAMPEP_0198547034 /NCGR_PEP_ID=MMETSP1462-20131121/67333_1 /TAXON_ID=1333877 /ORGANISM="Brandtodinium nutriculum, Strain RCC3387" /LENGTH=131 /DNA_ID=CAMNT_0044277499 /DNA_START=56 /DNA_END=451 /DNA_ORIENTATION=-
MGQNCCSSERERPGVRFGQAEHEPEAEASSMNTKEKLEVLRRASLQGKEATAAAASAASAASSAKERRARAGATSSRTSRRSSQALLAGVKNGEAQEILDGYRSKQEGKDGAGQKKSPKRTVKEDSQVEDF